MSVSTFKSIALSEPPSILRMSGRRLHGEWGSESYRLEKFWCLNLFDGAGELLIDGKPYPFQAGYAGITWPGPALVYNFKRKTVKTWVHFVPQPDCGTVPIPIMQDLGNNFETLRAQLQAVSSLYRTRPERAVARLWDILWHLVPEGISDSEQQEAYHPILARALDEIDTHISERIEVSSLAEVLGVSQSHLNRLFLGALGVTVGKYICAHRLEAASHLLLHTTMPIKEIGWKVGVRDPHHFNKMFRRHYGKSPSQFRLSS